LNKSDLTDQCAITPAEVDDIAKKYDTSFLTTSAKTGENVDLAFQKISETLVLKGKDEGLRQEPKYSEYEPTKETKMPQKTLTSVDRSEGNTD
jgi:hypothetical protein